MSTGHRESSSLDPGPDLLPLWPRLFQSRKEHHPCPKSGMPNVQDEKPPSLPDFLLTPPVKSDTRLPPGWKKPLPPWCHSPVWSKSDRISSVFHESSGRHKQQDR